MAERKMRYAVLTYFEKVGNANIGNKAKLQWDADGLLESYSYDQISKVIDYYFMIGSPPTWTKFLYGFDEYRKALIDKALDTQARKRNLAKMKEWLA